MESDQDRLKDIKAALAGYINESLFLLRKDTVPDDRAVHDIRVNMKKARATMRLIISQLDKKSYEREYDTYRKVGSVLSSWRETSVHRKTLKDLKKRYPVLFSLLAGNDKLAGLMKKPDNLSPVPTELISDVQKIDELLNKSRYRIRFYRLNNLEPHILFSELEVTYNMVSDLFLRARNYPKEKTLHEFRKRSKDFLYQLCFFRQMKPAVLKNLEKKLDVMTQNLGKYNDLAVLIGTLGYKYSRQGKDPELDELAVIIRQDQDRYLSEVWPAAHRIFGPRRKLISLIGFKSLSY